MVTVLKLGGSVITDKNRPETVDEASLDQSVAAIESYYARDAAVDDLVLVHGGGSFGHHRAAKHGVSELDGTTDASAIVDVHRAMTDLNDVVVSRLQAGGVPAIPVRPLSMALRRDSALHLSLDPLRSMVEEGFVPVLHGDVVVDEKRGATILSGDDVVVSLARSLEAMRVGLCSTVPGVLDSDEAVIPEIDSYETVADVLGESEATDVTGGMAKKVRVLLDLDAPACVFGLDDLEDFLLTGSAGTTIR